MCGGCRATVDPLRPATVARCWCCKKERAIGALVAERALCVECVQPMVLDGAVFDENTVFLLRQATEE